MSAHDAVALGEFLEPLAEQLEDVLVDFDTAGHMFGESGAGAYFLAEAVVRWLDEEGFLDGDRLLEAFTE